LPASFLVLETILDGFDEGFVLHTVLHLWIGVVARTKPLAGSRLAFAVFAVALGAVLSVVDGGVRRVGTWQNAEHDTRAQAEDTFHHTAVQFVDAHVFVPLFSRRGARERRPIQRP